MQRSEILEKARDAVSEILHDEFVDFRIEQFEEKHDSGWDVVVSYLLENKTDTVFPNAFSNFSRKYDRVYKRLLFDQDGKFEKFLIYRDV